MRQYIFNVDLLEAYDRIFLTMQGKLKRLPNDNEASAKLHNVVEELDRLGDMSHRIVNDLNLTSKVADNLRFKIRKITFVIDILKEELTNLENKMEA